LIRLVQAGSRTDADSHLGVLADAPANPPLREVLERLAGLDKDRGLARGCLVAANDDVNIKRIEFDAYPQRRVQQALAEKGVFELVKTLLAPCF
jgi:hypothetical protein